MSWRGFFLRGGINSDSKNISIETGNLVVQNEIISKGIVPSEIVTAGPATFTIAQLLTGFILRDPTGTSRADLLPTAALIIAGIKNVFIGSTFEFVINNTGSNGEIITVTTATGLTLAGTMTIDGGELRRFRVEVTGVTTPAVVIRDAGSGNGLSASEMEFLDGAIAGTQVANKAVIANSDINTGVSKVTALHIGATGSEILQEAEPLVPILTQVDDSALYTIGRRYRNPITGDVYVYLSGVTSCVVGSWITYYITSGAASVTALFAADAIGLIAIAMGIVENAKFGWFHIAGNNLMALATSGGDAAAGAHVYFQATGIVDDQVSAGNMVYGAVFSIQEGELAGNPAGFAGVSIQYPFVTNEST